MTVRLFGLAGSPNVLGAMLGLAEKGVEYELVAVPPPFQAPEHVERNPFGRIPAFEHDGFVLYETQAILRYVDRAFSGPALEPSDIQEAARMDQILSIVDSYLFPNWSATIGFERLVAAQFFGRPADEERIAASMPMALTCADALERLVSGPYLTGDTYSLADIRVLPHLAWLRQTPEGASILAGETALDQWFETASARPHSQAALSQLPAA